MVAWENKVHFLQDSILSGSDSSHCDFQLHPYYHEELGPVLLRDI